MILSDADIRKKIDSGKIIIQPFNESCLQPASYDLHLGTEFRVFKLHSTKIIDTKKPISGMMENVDIERSGYFVLHPGSFALALIEEVTGVDSRHVGRLEGKSSLARLGLIIHTTAGFLDPGNSLKLTLELFNASPLPIKLYPGMKIAQIAFEELSSDCERPYGSEGLGNKYLRDLHIGESRVHENFDSD